MTRALVLLAGLLAAGTPPLRAQSAAPSSEAPRAIEVPYTQFTLPNGLTVILHEDHSVPVIGVDVWYHVGSANERPGRTGFAHLFEHLMFMGSQHAPYGDFDSLLEAAGGTNNGSTNNDRTNYWITVPSNAIELALFLESDRMAYLLQAMTPATVDAQREVVKNERRQNYENEPYGMVDVKLGEMMYPENHPYHWPVIGYMPDLTAASYDDVVAFFKTYYSPSNASLVVAGDIEPARARALVEKWFSDVPAGPPSQPMSIPGVALSGVERETITDRVQLPLLTIAWLTPPQHSPGDAPLDVLADVLTGGKNSRLYKRLVYDMQIAQSVSAYQSSQLLSSQFVIQAMPRPGHTIDELQKVIDEEIEKLKAEGPTDREVQRAINKIESSFYRRMERLGGFGGKADQINAYFSTTGDADWFNEDLGRYRALAPSDIRAAAVAFLPRGRRAELTVLPAPETDSPTQP
jgi:zinc protease